MNSIRHYMCVGTLNAITGCLSSSVEVGSKLFSEPGSRGATGGLLRRVVALFQCISSVGLRLECVPASCMAAGVGATVLVVRFFFFASFLVPCRVLCGSPCCPCVNNFISCLPFPFHEGPRLD